MHTTIDRSRREVAAYCCDPGNVTEWYANIKAVQWEINRAGGTGSRFGSPASSSAARMAYTYEVVDLVAAQRFVMRSEGGPFPMETTYMWEDAEAGGTWMTLRNRGAADGIRRTCDTDPRHRRQARDREGPGPAQGHTRRRQLVLDRQLVRLPRGSWGYRNPH